MKTTVLLLLLSVVLVGCGARDLTKNPKGGDNTTENVNHVEILRQYQRVIRMGCNDVVKSDKIETVKEPTQNVKITPNSYDGLYSSRFLNTRTNSSPAIASNTHFVVDYSNGYFNMHVELGRNIVEYKFFRCTEWEGPKNKPTCKTKVIYEEGNVVLDVGYTEEYLDGSRTYNECSTSVTR